MMMHVILFMTAMLAPPGAARAETLSGEQLSGYEWARDNGIEDAHSCETESHAFNEGCMAFIEETKAPAQDGAGEKAEAPPALDDLPPGYDFPDDEFTILE